MGLACIKPSKGSKTRTPTELREARIASKAMVEQLCTVGYVRQKVEEALAGSRGWWSLSRLQLNLMLFKPNEYPPLTQFLDAFTVTSATVEELKFLFHGTPPPNLHSIIETGMRTGPGTCPDFWFSNDAHISHLYCNTPNAGEYKLIFFLVLRPQPDNDQTHWKIPATEPYRALPVATIWIRELRDDPRVFRRSSSAR